MKICFYLHRSVLMENKKIVAGLSQTASVAGIGVARLRALFAHLCRQVCSLSDLLISLPTIPIGLCPKTCFCSLLPKLEPAPGLHC